MTRIPNELMECFHLRGQHLRKFIETKESVCIRKEHNSQRIGLGHQHGRHFTVLGHQYGRRDVMSKHSIKLSKYISELRHVCLFLGEIMCSLCVLNELLEPFSLHLFTVAAYEFKWD